MNTLLQIQQCFEISSGDDSLRQKTLDLVVKNPFYIQIRHDIQAYCFEQGMGYRFCFTNGIA